MFIRERPNGLELGGIIQSGARRFMPLAREGLREIALATLVLGAWTAGVWWLYWPLALPLIVAWLWVISFFRDPRRFRTYQRGELCAPADGTVTEVTELPDHAEIGGPAVRIGIFLSLFNVHINRSPCNGTVRKISYHKGEFLDARHRDSGSRNESNTLVMDPDPPNPGPIIVRQVAGLLARRIICHAKVGDPLVTGGRFGMIKFGSRTELIFPRCAGTTISVKVGDKVRAGLSIVARQAIDAETPDSTEEPVVAESLNSGATPAAISSGPGTG